MSQGHWRWVLRRRARELVLHWRYHCHRWVHWLLEHWRRVRLAHSPGQLEERCQPDFLLVIHRLSRQSEVQQAQLEARSERSEHSIRKPRSGLVGVLPVGLAVLVQDWHLVERLQHWERWQPVGWRQVRLQQAL